MADFVAGRDWHTYWMSPIQTPVNDFFNLLRCYNPCDVMFFTKHQELFNAHPTISLITIGTRVFLVCS